MNVDQTKKIVADYSFYLRDKLGCGSSSEVYRGLSLKTSTPKPIQAKQLQ
jgi:hypothetical protein